jgi:hypothetical protein
MDDQQNHTMYAFPAVQGQEQLQLAIQSLAPMRRHLRGSSRRRFEYLIRDLLHHLPAYNSVNHLTPMEFVLLGLIIELADTPDDKPATEHPPFP